MINHICDICKEYVQDNWILRIYDDRESVEINGHKNCIDELDIKVRNIKDVHKKSVKQTLKEINFIREV